MSKRTEVLQRYEITTELDPHSEEPILCVEKSIDGDWIRFSDLTMLLAESPKVVSVRKRPGQDIILEG